MILLFLMESFKATPGGENKSLKMSDALTVNSRAFFERTKLKLSLSIVLGASALFAIAFCAVAGARSASAQDLRSSVSNANDDHIINQYTSLMGGYGFAAFLFILAFFLLSGTACYASPLIMGSPNERKTLSVPEEIEGTYSPQV